MNIHIFKLLGVMLALAAGSMLSACSGVDSDLLDAISSSDDAELCIYQNDLGVGIWGKEDGVQYLAQLKKGDGHRASQVAVGEMVFPRLVSEGYVEDRQEKIQGAFFQQVTVNMLTDKGRKHFKWDEPVCVGDREVSKITEYTEPAEAGGMVITRVNFEYDIEGNDFSDDIGLEEVARTHAIEGMDGEGEAVLVKTNNGWKSQRVRW
jgi:hypothetical protein